MTAIITAPLLLVVALLAGRRWIGVGRRDFRSIAAHRSALDIIEHAAGAEDAPHPVEGSGHVRVVGGPAPSAIRPRSGDGGDYDEADFDGGEPYRPPSRPSFPMARDRSLKPPVLPAPAPPGRRRMRFGDDQGPAAPAGADRPAHLKSPDDADPDDPFPVGPGTVTAPPGWQRRSPVQPRLPVAPPPPPAPVPPAPGLRALRREPARAADHVADEPIEPQFGPRSMPHSMAESLREHARRPSPWAPAGDDPAGSVTVGGGDPVSPAPERGGGEPTAFASAIGAQSATRPSDDPASLAGTSDGARSEVAALAAATSAARARNRRRPGRRLRRSRGGASAAASGAAATAAAAGAPTAASAASSAAAASAPASTASHGDAVTASYRRGRVPSAGRRADSRPGAGSPPAGSTTGRARHPHRAVTGLASAAAVLAVVAGAFIVAGRTGHHPGGPAVHAAAGPVATTVPTSTVPPASATTAPAATLVPTQVSSMEASYTATSALVAVSIESANPCWIELRSGPTGPVTFEGILTAASTQSFQTSGGMWLRLGNPAGVKLTIDGSPVTLPSTANPFNVIVSGPTGA